MTILIHSIVLAFMFIPLLTESFLHCAGYGGIDSPAREISGDVHRPLFIGEFGEIQKGDDHAAQKRMVEEILAAIESDKVPLAALWVFDLKAQEHTLNVTFDNPRKDLLESCRPD